MSVKRILQSIFILSVILPVHQVMAQGQVANRLIRGSNFQLAVGYNFHRINLEDLNRSITASGFPQLSENVHSISFLTQNISNDWMVTLKTSYSFTNEVAHERKEIGYRNLQYSLGLGYNVLSSPKTRLLPAISGTLVRNFLHIQDKTNTSANFQSLIQSPGQEADLRNYSYLADVGLAYHYMFYRRDRENETGSRSTWVPVIIKAGYQFELGNGAFKFDGQEVAGVPNIGLGGFYTSIHIGLGTKLLPIN